MSTVVGSVIYKQAIEYIDDFLESLKDQTDQNFDVLLLNDNVEEELFLKIFEKYIQYFGDRLKVLKMKMIIQKPYILRIELLKTVKSYGYDLLVLCDCDDKCALNRVENCKMAYGSERWFFYNELLGFKNEKIMPSMPSITENVMQIGEYNYLGLSNTVLVMSHINEKFIDSLREGDTQVFDWYLFVRILLEGGTGEKINNTFTFYRVHSANIAGISDRTLVDFKKEIAVKKQHYKLLKKYSPAFEELFQKYANLKLDEYSNMEKSSLSYWWGNLK